MIVLSSLTFFFTGSFIWLNVSIINLFISPIVMVFGLYQCYQYAVSWAYIRFFFSSYCKFISLYVFWERFRLVICLGDCLLGCFRNLAQVRAERWVPVGLWWQWRVLLRQGWGPKKKPGALCLLCSQHPGCANGWTLGRLPAVLSFPAWFPNRNRHFLAFLYSSSSLSSVTSVRLKKNRRLFVSLLK